MLPIHAEGLSYFDLRGNDSPVSYCKVVITFLNGYLLPDATSKKKTFMVGVLNNDRISFVLF